MYYYWLMSGSCHLDRASNVEIGVECQIFFIVIFFNCSQVLQFGAHSRYYKGALTQKRSFLVICTTFRSAFHVLWKNQNKHSTLNSLFNALSKWHEPDISLKNISSANELGFLKNVPNWAWPLLISVCNYFSLKQSLNFMFGCTLIQ